MDRLPAVASQALLRSRRATCWLARNRADTFKEKLFNTLHNKWEIFPKDQRKYFITKKEFSTVENVRISYKYIMFRPETYTR